jgi:fatty acid desaturase
LPGLFLLSSDFQLALLTTLLAGLVLPALLLAAALTRLLAAALLTTLLATLVLLAALLLLVLVVLVRIVHGHLLLVDLMRFNRSPSRSFLCVK